MRAVAADRRDASAAAVDAEAAADELLAGPRATAAPWVQPGPDRRAGGTASGPSACGCAGSTNTSKETYDDTGLPGSVKIGVPSSPTMPKPCGLPGCIATPPNRHRAEPAQHLLDHVVVALADPAAGDDQVGAHQLVVTARRVNARGSSETMPTR